MSMNAGRSERLAKWLEGELGPGRLSHGRSGDQLQFKCPFCGRPKLQINVGGGRHHGLWDCKRCGQKGNSNLLVQVVRGLSWAKAQEVLRREIYRPHCRSVREILEETKCLGTSVVVDEEDDEDDEDPSLELPEGFIPVWDGRRWSEPRYLRDRGVPSRISAEYKLGYCLRGRYANRIIVPAYEDGRLVFFQGRTWTDRLPRYDSPPIARDQVLLGLDQARGAEQLLVVEGPFDVLGCARAGKKSVALLGKQATGGQLAKLARFGAKQIVVLLDPEAAKEANSIARSLSIVCPQVSLGRLPTGVDPGSATPEQIAQAIADAIRPKMRIFD